MDSVTMWTLGVVAVGSIGTAATIVLLWGRPPRVWHDWVRSLILVMVVAGYLLAVPLVEWGSHGGDVGILILATIGATLIFILTGGGWIVLAATGAFRAQQVDASPAWRRRVALACMVSGMLVPAHYLVTLVYRLLTESW